MRKLLIISYLVLFYTFHTTQPLCITRVFYHQGVMSDRIVCYFDQQADVKETSKSKNVKKKQEILDLFVPAQLITNDKVLEVLERLKRAHKEGYAISFQKTFSPESGIKILVQYDPEEINCDYSLHKSITEQQSLVISFYKKRVLEVLKNTDSVLKQVKGQPIKIPHKIIIDCGHGGDDLGKVGVNAVREKDINLSIGKQVALLLKKKGYDVNLTRNTDITVPLDMRTSRSNKMNADLFLSIHSNGSSTTGAQGIETFWGSVSRLAKKKTLHNHMFDKLQQRDKASEFLAQQLHKNIVASASEFYQPIDRKVKESVFQVLIGTEMPAALIEVGFISNQKEAVFLSDPVYQKALAHGICKGVEEYFKGLAQI